MALDLAHTPLADLLAPVWFLLCWVGYTYYADGERGKGIDARDAHLPVHLGAPDARARQSHGGHPDHRQPDAQRPFFASTTVLIIAGLIAVLGARERAMAVLAELPFAVRRRRRSGTQGAPADSPVRLRILQVHLGVPAVQLLPDPGRLCAGPEPADPASAGSPSASRTSPAQPASTPIAASGRTTSGSPRSAGSSIPGCSCS